MKKLDPAVAASLADAIRSVEARSCAELVIEVRAQSGSYAHADHRFAAMVSFVTLLFVLFSPWTFEPPWVPLCILAVYAVALLVSRESNVIRRLMTTRSDRDRKVRTHTAATFVERGVANTQRESGLVIYLSLLERRIEMIADRGVLDAVPVLEWNQLAETTRKRKATLHSLLEVLRALEPLLVRCMPARADDRDELANEVRFLSE